MDKIFSTRLDEDLVRQIDHFAKQRAISKKKLIETAVRAYMVRAGERPEHEILDRSFGAWKRPETPAETWRQARKAFTEGFRHPGPRS